MLIHAHRLSSKLLSRTGLLVQDETEGKLELLGSQPILGVPRPGCAPPPPLRGPAWAWVHRDPGGSPLNASSFLA